MKSNAATSVDLDAPETAPAAKKAPARRSATQRASATPFASRVWKTLSAVNVNNNTDSIGNLTYLSWTFAWSTLCNHYPESDYEFWHETYADGSVMTFCRLTVRQGDEALERLMHLPVMNNKKSAVVNPNARQISDAYMRCLTKACAACGLALYLYQRTDLPEPEIKERERQQKGVGDLIEQINRFKRLDLLNAYVIEVGEDGSEAMTFIESIDDANAEKVRTAIRQRRAYLAEREAQNATKKPTVSVATTPTQ